MTQLLTTEIPALPPIWDSNAALYPEFTLHFSSDFLCKTQYGKLNIRTPFQNFRRPKKPRLPQTRDEAPQKPSWQTVRYRRATYTLEVNRSHWTCHFFYRDTNALVKKKVLIRLHLHVLLPRGRGITSRSRIKHGLDKNAGTNCASQTGVRAALAEFCLLTKALCYPALPNLRK